MVVKERENRCNVPEGLVRLLGMELNAEDDDQKTGEGERAGCAEERYSFGEILIVSLALVDKDNNLVVPKELVKFL
jgi:hypothetical protein